MCCICCCVSACIWFIWATVCCWASSTCFAFCSCNANSRSLSSSSFSRSFSSASLKSCFCCHTSSKLNLVFLPGGPSSSCLLLLLFSVWRTSCLSFSPFSLSSFSFFLAVAAAYLDISLSPNLSWRDSSSSCFSLNSSSMPLCLHCLVSALRKASIKLVACSRRVRAVTLTNVAGRSFCKLAATCVCLPSRMSLKQMGTQLRQLHKAAKHHLQPENVA